VTERLLLAKYLLAQYLREQAHWRLDTVDGDPARAAHCVLALIDAAAYIRELPGDDPWVAALTAAGCFAGGCFVPSEEMRDLIRRWQFDLRWSAGPKDLLSALAARCASPVRTAVIAPQPRAAVDGGAIRALPAADSDRPQPPAHAHKRARHVSARGGLLRRDRRNV